jgi:DNA-directed RNA polymerase subunit RPC12/RpoP
MKTSVSLLKVEQEASVFKKNESFNCTRCLSEFYKPVFAVVTSNANSEGYYACPKCLTKVQVPVLLEDKILKPSRAARESLTKRVADGKSLATTCAFYAGYLKKRPSGMPVPEACYACGEMLDCMLH